MHRLPKRVRLALERNGITSVEQIIPLYPAGLLQLCGFGMMSLRAVERALMPGARYQPPNPGRQKSKPLTAKPRIGYVVTLVKAGRVTSRTGHTIRSGSSMDDSGRRRG